MIIEKSSSNHVILESGSVITYNNENEVSYDKLQKTLIDKRMTRTDLKEASGISFNVLAKTGRNEFASMESLYKVCVSLESILEILSSLTVL